ncbi:MAG TPA: hypothetical protein VH593_06820 [Ktedonobacteraceae bacterium]|jgi:hypothetical protein
MKRLLVFDEISLLQIAPQPEDFLMRRVLMLNGDKQAGILFAPGDCSGMIRQGGMALLKQAVVVFLSLVTNVGPY